MENRLKKKRRKSMHHVLKERLVVATLLIYFLYTVFTIFDMSKEHSGVITDRPNALLRSVWLDDVAFHQSFMGENIKGIRIWLSNPYNISEGVVSVRIGSESTGEILYTEEILVTDISDSVLEDYVDIVPTEVRFDDGTVYFIELDALSCPDKTIKTYLGASSSYVVSHAGDERDFSSKMLCIAFIQKSMPFIFGLWIFISSLVAMMVVFIFSNSEYELQQQDIILPSPRESLVLIPMLVLIGLFGTGILNSNSFTTRTEHIGEKALEDGYALPEHSSFTQEFTVKRNDLKEIDITLENFFENVGTFVVSIQKGQDEIIQSVQNVELEYINDTAYVWDVSELGLEKGENYDLYIYTGFIEDDQEEPVLKRIECVYKK